MEKATQEFKILIPSSLTAEKGDQKVKTIKIGSVARAASIYRVEGISIYIDPDHDESDLIGKVLKYAEAPPYLKKTLFGIDKKLKYVGAIPPLQIPSHNVTKDISVGEYREGLVLERSSEEKVGSDYCARVDIGLDEPALLVENEEVSEEERITVRTISCESPVKVRKVNKSDVPYYWGYDTTVCKNLEKKISDLRDEGWSIISTSRYGEKVSTENVDTYLSDKVALIFGSPDKGVDAFIDQDQLVDDSINTVVKQGTKTVRTEEAIYSTLAILNLERR